MRRRSWVLLVSLLSVAALLAGCSGGRDAASVIGSAHYGDADSLRALYQVAGTDGGAQAAQQILASGATGERRWAAVTAYLGGGTEPKVLKPYLADKDLSVRVLAASGAVLLGDRDAFPVLIELLGHDDWAHGSEPPQVIWQIADRGLVQATAMSAFGPPLDGSAGQARTAQAKWKQWWSDHKSALQYNSAKRLWSTK